MLLRAARCAFLVMSLAAFSAGAETPGRRATLEAIHQLENPRNLTRPGKHGELGAYQFRAATWHMHTNLPFSSALDRRTSDTIAVIHYEWLKRGLVAAGMPATTYNIALAWNSGLTAVIRGRSPRVAHGYAERAVNLATSFAVSVPRGDTVANNAR
jgi:hypothetical protein